MMPTAKAKLTTVWTELTKGEHARLRDGEESHRLGKAVDRRAPLLVQEQKNRGDQRAGVPDPDPPDEIDDVEAPGHGNVDAPDPDPAGEEVADRAQKEHPEEERHEQADPPEARGLLS